MHITAQENCQLFYDCYGDAIKQNAPNARVMEIGSQDVTGSIRECCPTEFDYIGVDVVEGKGVDIILNDPYSLPFPDESIDVVVSSSCFEHTELFWVLYLEIMRILRPSGLFYLNVPSNGAFHRYPVDCWRFYPDSGCALISWAKRNNFNPELLESYTSFQKKDIWNDFVAVFLKDKIKISEYPRRIIDGFKSFTNGLTSRDGNVINYQQFPEDFIMRILLSDALNKNCGNR
jgi:SAM-dependent methyltransferase